MDALLAWLPEILATVVAVCGGIISTTSLIKTLKAAKVTKAETARLSSQVQVTQEGIVNAFKSAKIPAELKININNQVTTLLDKWGKDILAKVQENEDLRTRLAVFNTRVLAWTAASNKLTEGEKAELAELLRLLEARQNEVNV